EGEIWKGRGGTRKAPFFGPHTKKALRRRRTADMVFISKARSTQRCIRYMKFAAIDASAAHEIVVRRKGRSASVVRIRVVEVVAKVAVVENVYVRDARVIDVDVARIAEAVAIPRAERFAESEREPAYSAAEAKAEAPASAAVESDECRSQVWTRIVRSRAPAPTVADVRPTSIMERRIAPRRVVNPRPAPRPNIAPIAVAVRSPTDVNNSRIPDVAIFGNFVPSAVVVEVAVADGVARNIFCGSGIIFLSIAAISPAIKTIWPWSWRNAVTNILRAVKLPPLAGLDRIGLAAGRNFALTANYADASGFTVFRNVNAKRTGLADGKCQIWGVYFVDFTFAEFANMEIERTFCDAHLNRIVIEVEKRKSGHASYVN